MKRTAFTMIELIFVIVIMGIIGKFGTEFLYQAYESFIFSNTNNKLQARSAKTVEFIASRLQHRIKDSVIARTGQASAPVGIGSASGNTFTVLEWISADVDGFRGTDKPYWSGIIDLDASNAATLVSPDTNITAINALISTLSNSNSDISDAAIYFIGSNNDINSFGYVGGLANQNGSIHPIDAIANNFVSSQIGVDFSGVDLYEYYKLSWTANAIIWTDPNSDGYGTLTYFYDYQPWNNIQSGAGKSEVIMEGVTTFQFMSIGSIMKIQVCAGSTLLEDYSLCKEKTIF